MFRLPRRLREDQRLFGRPRPVAPPALEPAGAGEGVGPAGSIVPGDLFDYVAASIRNRYRVVDDNPHVWLVYCRRCSYAIVITKPAGEFFVDEFNFLRLLHHQYEQHGINP